MKTWQESKRSTSQLIRFTLALAVVWTLVVALSFLWSSHEGEQAAVHAATEAARAQFLKDVLYRRWNTLHGGVYAPVTETTPPNPYLTQVEEREIRTPSGRLLTMINPAYMTRQVHELSEQTVGVHGHITSLHPINPSNKPDEWEKAALQGFETGIDEVVETVEQDGIPYLRLMRPLVTEPSCLKCHAEQGYRTGDIRGGISISVPLAPYQSFAEQQIASIAVGHGILWLLGLVWLGAGSVRFSRHFRERDQITA
ncbi:DUF3365 domain-containing protein, partial [bacterium]|nr:DUF3365 domain-containing protein [bacterium]